MAIMLASSLGLDLMIRCSTSTMQGQAGTQQPQGKARRQQ